MVTKEDGFIFIKIPNHSYATYDIEATRIEFEGLDSRLEHLRQKMWWTPEIEKEFVQICQK